MWKIRSDKDNRKLLNELPTIRLFDLEHPYGIGIYNRLSLRPLTWLSKIIRRVRNAPINHMGVVHWKAGSGGLVFTEANEKGVNTTSLYSKIDKWTKRDDILIALIPKKQRLLTNEEVVKKVKLEIGKPYGFFALLQFLLATLRRHPLRSKALREGRVHVCSTLMIKILTNWISAWTYTPKEIWDSKSFTKYRIKLK